MDQERRTGLTAGISTYLLWGAFPLFFHLLGFVGPVDILCQRIVWSGAFVLLMLAILRQPWTWWQTVTDRKAIPKLIAASLLIGANWLTYIAAVASGHVVEASLGYFINPLVSVVLGVIVFHEKLSKMGIVGLLAALVGVIVIAAGNLSTLWISLTLALTFGLYGVLKKQTPLPALPGLLVESMILMPLALGWLIVTSSMGSHPFGTTLWQGLLLAAAGPLTAIPLWLFATAATRLPLGVLGVLQYLPPTIQFLLGIFFFGQHVSATYWAGLVAVWIGSAIYFTTAIRTPAEAPLEVEPEP